MLLEREWKAEVTLLDEKRLELDKTRKELDARMKELTAKEIGIFAKSALSL